jgi:FkbM family methyltransferase
MIKKLINKILGKLGYSISKKVEKTIFFKKSYSQSGEDVIMDYIFRLRNIALPSYIDIGANHPFYLSNTALFYEKGCRGVNVEANPELIELFKTHRPNDVSINIGIADEEGLLDFYIMEDNTLSSFSRLETDAMIANGKNLSSIKKIKLTTIQHILKEYCNGVFPDILSLDVEGLDFQILKTIDFKNNSPKVICVEAAEYSPTGTGTKKTELINFIIDNGYYEYANTNLNAIMVKNSFWFL